MKERIFALLGIVGPLVAYTSIGISIWLSPWFSWQKNALSDLGHPLRSPVAPIYNGGLLIAGAIIVFYATTTFRNYAKYTSLFLIVSAFLLQLVATFNEVYTPLHGLVSILFFVSIGVVSIVYAIERKSSLSVIVFILGLCSWLFYELQIYQAGVAVPELISSIAVALLLVTSAIQIYLCK